MSINIEVQSYTNTWDILITKTNIPKLREHSRNLQHVRNNIL